MRRFGKGGTEDDGVGMGAGPPPAPPTPPPAPPTPPPPPRPGALLVRRASINASFVVMVSTTLS